MPATTVTRTPAQSARACRMCARIGYGKCTGCGSCNLCGCICRSCSSCREKHGPNHFCKFCQRCKKVCECRARPHYTHPSELGVVKSTTRINTLQRKLGLELELANWETVRAYEFSKVKYVVAHDSSVKPSEQEMVLNPMYGDRFLSSIVELATGLESSNATVNETCGLHVHVEGGDLSYWAIRRLLTVYSRIEGEIYDYLILPHRRDIPTVTHYCQMLTRPHTYCDRCERYDRQHPDKPVPESIGLTLTRMRQAKSTSDLKACLFRMMYGLEDLSNHMSEVQAKKAGKYEWIRYFGLNLHSWMYRGTIEFRMKEGTIDVTELINWPLWCGWLVSAIDRMSDRQAEEMTLERVTKEFMPKFLYEWVLEKRRSR
jgi:hypothetical protein